MLSKEIAKIQFYTINKCGYYDLISKKHTFCTINDVLRGLKLWTAKKSISKTITFSPKEDSNQLPVYCYDLFHEPGKGSVLTTWNGNPSDEDGQISAVNIFAPLGTDDLEISEFSEGYIAGYETYFWFPHNRNVLATVRVGTRLQNGHIGLCDYLQSFLEYHHPEYVFDAREAKGCFLYGKSNDDASLYSPLFSSTRRRLPGKLEEIRANRERIYKIARKTVISPLAKAEDGTLWQSLLNTIFLPEAKTAQTNVDIETRFNFSPNTVQLDEMIKEWAGEKTANSVRAGDIGVIYRGDSGTTHWFSSCLAKGEFSIDVSKNKQGLIKADSLANALNSIEAQIFASAYGQ